MPEYENFPWITCDINKIAKIRHFHKNKEKIALQKCFNVCIYIDIQIYTYISIYTYKYIYNFALKSTI